LIIYSKLQLMNPPIAHP